MAMAAAAHTSAIHHLAFEEVMKSTDAVQVGARSSAGTSSAAVAGKSAQWKPSSLMRTPATTRSSASFKGEAKPSPKSGAATSCRASAVSATMRASLTRVAGVGALEGAVEVVRSIDDLLRKWFRHGVDSGVELLDARRPQQD